MTAKPLSRDEIARRVGRDIPDGAYVNLGIGLPTLAANYVPVDREVIYHSENGLLGMGPAPKKGEEDPDIINAGKQPVTLLPGASIFHHTDSFAQCLGVALPRKSQNLHVATRGLEQALENFAGRSFAGAVGSKQAEALTAMHLEIEAINRSHGVVVLDQIANANSCHLP